MTAEESTFASIRPIKSLIWVFNKFSSFNRSVISPKLDSKIMVIWQIMVDKSTFPCTRAHQSDG